MNKFKVGDKVKRLCSYNAGMDVGEIGIVSGFDNGYYNNWPFVVVNGMRTGSHLPERLELVSETVAVQSDKVPDVKFILQYELDKDPFETFATMKEVEARIKELAKRTDLKRESIKVYEIAKTYDVKLETRVIFGGVKQTWNEKNTGAKVEALKAAVKRGRPFIFQCPDCAFKGKSGRQLGAHKRYNHK